MEVKWIALIAVVALVCSFAMLPAMADEAGEEVVEDSGNTPPVETCCEACGCCGGEKSLGDLLLVGIAMMGLATLSATRK